MRPPPTGLWRTQVSFEVSPTSASADAAEKYMFIRTHTFSHGFRYIHHQRVSHFHTIFEGLISGKKNAFWTLRLYLLQFHYTRGLKYPKKSDRRLTGSGLPAGFYTVTIRMRPAPTRMIEWCLCGIAAVTASRAGVDLDGFMERTALGCWFRRDSNRADGKRQRVRCSHKNQDKFAIVSMTKKFLHRCIGAHARVHVHFLRRVWQAFRQVFWAPCTCRCVR